MKKTFKIILLWFFVYNSTNLLSLPKKLKPIVLDEGPLQALQQDMPLLEARLQSEEALWFLGQNYLWQYKIKEKTLKQMTYNVENQSSSKFASLHIGKRDVFVATDSKLIQVEVSETTKVFSYESLDPFGMSHSIQEIGEDKLLWVQTRGIQTIDSKTKESLSFKSFFPTETHYIFRKNNSSVLYVEDNKVYLENLKTSRRELFFEGEYDLKFLEKNPPWIQTGSEKLIYILDQEGNLVQEIPIEEGRKLIALQITEEVDAYLFEDLLLQINNKKLKKTDYIEIPNLGTHNIESFELKGEVLLLLSGGFPFIFSLSS